MSEAVENHNDRKGIRQVSKRCSTCEYQWRQQEQYEDRDDKATQPNRESECRQGYKRIRYPDFQDDGVVERQKPSKRFEWIVAEPAGSSGQLD